MIFFGDAAILPLDQLHYAMFFACPEAHRGIALAHEL